VEFRRVMLGLGVVPVLAGAALFGACGGDDDGGTGSDEDFVADLCEIMKNFSDDLDNLEEEAEGAEEFDEIAELLSGPIGDLADGFADLNPPEDLQDWHEEASEELDKLSDDLDSGELTEEAMSGESPIPDPPEEAAERLSALAEDNEDCQDADFDF
jgi:hypothetical protein